ncbi:HNH endonuclease [Pseudoalteromonas arabiensis]|uniref:HNH endonuclease n=1 Tax=Pseudoalteromonas arabiensis TaxID=874454 RepID=UPI000784082D|nr:HNH endonuclease [Pseudoalteromonas arabiensis]
MFNVTRPEEIPQDLGNGKQYNKPEVVKALKKMFFGKCYLCERGNVEDPEIEHFLAQANGGGRVLWENLFYSCSRCNSIKSNKYNDLLDCTDDNIDVSAAIKLVMTVTPNDDVIVEAAIANPNAQVINTVKLLNECYNNQNTGLRGVSRESLIEQIYEYLIVFIQTRGLLKNPSTSEEREKEALGVLEKMMRPKHPFSAFWRWQYLGDSFLVDEYPELLNLLTD